MRNADLFQSMFKPKRKDRILGVSEAVGTVLLLGISVALAGGVALWVSQIEEGEEGLYVDLWASVQGDQLSLMHRGGDLLDGDQTYITLINSNGVEISRSTYKTLSGGSDEEWGPGEELLIDISGAAVTDNFEVLVTTLKDNGISTVVLSNNMVKSGSASGLPDLAITQVNVLDTDSTVVTRINDDETYLVYVNVYNFGADMNSTLISSPYFSEKADNTIENLMLFDAVEDLDFSDVSMVHYDSSGNVVTGAGSEGYLSNGDRIEVTYTWTRSSSNPRTLGAHTLNVKVVPFFGGEQHYRNNYVERRFTVDKLVKPMAIYGPDPGIYDISFSNNAPNSGEEVTVTVIIQNSGDQPINVSHGVHLVVSTYQPAINSEEAGDESYDWRVDYPGHEGKWRHQVHTIPMANDDEFPTCIKPNIALLPGAYFFYYFTLEARVDVPGGEQWVYAVIDAYESPTHREGVAIQNGDETGDNFALGNIQVLPRIMVVDDDSGVTATEDDVTSAVIEALVGSGVTVDKIYTTTTVEDNGISRDAPAYTYVQDEINAPAMEDYDIVIWVTGHDDDPLTNKPVSGGSYGGNVQELMNFMDGNKYLLIVGDSPFEGLSDLFPSSGDTTSMAAGAGLEEFNDASAFLHDYLGIKVLSVDVDLPDSEPYHLVGVDTGEGGLTPEPEPGVDYTIETLELEDGNALSEMFVPRTTDVDGFELPLGMITTEAEISGATNKVNSIRNNGTPDETKHNAQFRSVVLGFDISKIQYLNEKIDLIASVLDWFDWTINVGRDLAVTKMELSILTKVSDTEWETNPIADDNLPKYLDTIEIEVTVRNNGPSVESSAVMFYVTGPDGIELPVATGIPDPRPDRSDYDNPQDVSLQGEGGEETIFKLWLAVGVGTYTFRVVVDPYHLITEISEENNDITYSTSTVTSFVTQNNILIVDDDNSDDNYITESEDGKDPIPDGDDKNPITYPSTGEPSEVLTNVLTNLSYDHDIYTIEAYQDPDSGDIVRDSGLDIRTLKRYNSIIWVFGDAGDSISGVKETLTDYDIEELTKYLDGDYEEAKYLPEHHNENVMFVGRNFVPELIKYKSHVAVSDQEYEGGTRDLTVGMFVRDYLGLDSSVTELDIETGSSRYLFGNPWGEFVEDIYTGIEYWDDDFSKDFEYAELPIPVDVPDDDRETKYGLLAYAGGDDFDLVASQFSMMDDEYDYYFQTLVHSWQMPAAMHDAVETSLYEILFLSLHWFNTPESHPELVSRNQKISLENDNPVLGNSYLMEVEVANLGGVAGGGTVRFMDGNTLIKSENIFLEPDRTTTLEAIWTPLYAGNRTVSIWIDRYDDYDEVFELKNNVPEKNLYVYYFWDDMENGTENWDHDSTVLLINGEGKLDYMEEPTESNIIDSWGDVDGFKLNNEVDNSNVEKIFRSSKTSYYMHEPNGYVYRPIDVVMVLDSSGSMSGQKIADAKTAAKTFIDQMNEDDRLCLFTFSTTSGREAPLKRFDYTYMNAAGKSMAKSQVDAVSANGYTPIWDTTGTAIQYALDNDELGRTPAVVILTDGDDHGTEGREDGSETYAPGSPEGTSAFGQTWGRTDGLAWGDAEKTFRDQNGGGNDIQRYRGSYVWENLASSGSLPDDSGDGNAETRTGLYKAPIYTFSIGLGNSPHDSSYENGGDDPPSGTGATFTTEYDLWLVARSSSYGGSGHGAYYYAPDSSQLLSIYNDIFQDIQDLAQQATRSPGTRATETVFSDGFETDLSSWTTTGITRSTSGERTGSYCAQFDGDGDYYMTTTLNLLNYDSAELTFWLRDDNGMEDSGHGSAYDWFQVSVNGGSGWNLVSTIDPPDGSSVAYDQHTVDLSPYVGGTNVQVQFHGHTSASSENWRVDDVEVTGETSSGGVGNGLMAEYYDNDDFTDMKLSRTDPIIEFDWGTGSPDSQISSNTFSVRWTGYVEAQYSETYTFYTTTDDGVKLWVNDQLIINQWVDQSPTEWSGTISLTGGQMYSIRMDYYENTGDAEAKLEWESASQSRGVIPQKFLFTTFGGGGGGGNGDDGDEIDPLNPWTDGSTVNSNKHLESQALDLNNVDSAMLSFYHKYNMKHSANGGVIMVGTSDTIDGDYNFRYVQPHQPYTGNILISEWGANTDDFGTEMRWCWNGLSGGGTLNWEHITVDLSRFTGNFVKVRFQYLYTYGGTGYGWIIDDVSITISTDSDHLNKDDSLDSWRLQQATTPGVQSHSGEYAWYNGDPTNSGGDFKDGIDNSLYTRPIDLTNARTATLHAYMRFNINQASGRPPDGFRVEVSDDNGVSWIPLSLGVRSAWSVSGSTGDAADGVLGDRKSYTGLNEGNNWVRASTLTRLITNLNGFIGNTVILRFRVVTNTNEDHYEDASAGFFGFYIDDVVVYGESLESTRSTMTEEMAEYRALVEKHEAQRGPPRKGESREIEPIYTGPSDTEAAANDLPEEEDDVTASKTDTRSLWGIALLSGSLAMIAVVTVYVKRKYHYVH